MLRLENDTLWSSVIIISHSEAEENQRNIEHVVKMFRLLTNNI